MHVETGMQQYCSSLVSDWCKLHTIPVVVDSRRGPGVNSLSRDKKIK